MNVFLLKSLGTTRTEAVWKYILSNKRSFYIFNRVMRVYEKMATCGGFGEEHFWGSNKTTTTTADWDIGTVVRLKLTWTTTTQQTQNQLQRRSTTLKHFTHYDDGGELGLGYMVVVSRGWLCWVCNGTTTVCRVEVIFHHTTHTHHSQAVSYRSLPYAEHVQSPSGISLRVCQETPSPSSLLTSALDAQSQNVNKQNQKHMSRLLCFVLENSRGYRPLFLSHANNACQWRGRERAVIMNEPQPQTAKRRGR